MYLFRSVAFSMFFLVLLCPAFGWTLCTAVGPDGQPGFDSCAETRVTLTVPPLVIVSRLEALSLGSFHYPYPPESTNDFCIWYNTERFSLKIFSANSQGDNRFYLTSINNASVRIPYQLTWYDQPGAKGTEIDLSQQENIVQTRLRLSEKSFDSECAQKNTSLRVTIPLHEMAGKPEDTYFDAITVLVSVQ